MGKSKTANVQASNTPSEECIGELEEQLQKLKDAFNARNDVVTNQLNNLSKLITENIKTQNEKLDDTVSRVTKLEQDLLKCNEEKANETKKVKELTKKLEETIAHGRRLNLIITGLPEYKDENVLEVINEFLLNKLKVPQNEVARLVFRDYHRLGPIDRNNTSEDNRLFKKVTKANEDLNRPIIIGFIQQHQRNLVLKHGKNLAGLGNFAIKPDLTPTLAQERNKLMVVRRRIKDISERNYAHLTYQSYKPVLICKIDGNYTVYSEKINIEDCE